MDNNSDQMYNYIKICLITNIVYIKLSIINHFLYLANWTCLIKISQFIARN